MIDLEQYRKNARENNLCSEYSDIWDSCNSNKQIMDMCLGVKGVDFLCDSIAKNWGISPEVICSKFGKFINGKYVRDIDGYTSKIYCKYDGSVVADTTIVTLVGCNVDIRIPTNAICEVYCTEKCDIRVSGDGECVFVCYGNKDDIVISGECRNYKRINKKNRDTYE